MRAQLSRRRPTAEMSDDFDGKNGWTAYTRNGRASSGAQARAGAPGPAASAPDGPVRGGFGVGMDWPAALELTIATQGAEPYRSRLKELFPQVIAPQQMGLRGWTAVRALPYLDAPEFTAQETRMALVAMVRHAKAED